VEVHKPTLEAAVLAVKVLVEQFLEVLVAVELVEVVVLVQQSMVVAEHILAQAVAVAEQLMELVEMDIKV
jgi:hypothetical protein